MEDIDAREIGGVTYIVRVTCDSCGMTVEQSARSAIGANWRFYRPRLIEAGWMFVKGWHDYACYCPKCSTFKVR
jgi:hypothetical protein